MDNIENDFERAGLSLDGITTGRNRVRLEELVGDKERWKDITAASMARRAFRMTAWPDIVSNSNEVAADGFIAERGRVGWAVEGEYEMNR